MATGDAGERLTTNPSHSLNLSNPICYLWQFWPAHPRVLPIFPPQPSDSAVLCWRDPLREKLSLGRGPERSRPLGLAKSW